METATIVILYEEDLKPTSKDKTIHELCIFDFSGYNTTSVLRSSPIVIYIDSKCETVVIKNRYGYKGVVQH